MRNNPLQPRFTLPARVSAPPMPPKKKRRRRGLWFLAILGEIVLLALFSGLGASLFLSSTSWTLRLVGWIVLLILWSNAAAAILPHASSSSHYHTPLAQIPALSQNTTGYLQVLTKEQLETYAKSHRVRPALPRNQWHRAGISSVPPPPAG